MNQAMISRAQDALERLSQASASTTAQADAEAVRSVLNELAGMKYVPDWGVHVDGEPMYCPTEDKARSLLRYCRAKQPDGDSHLVKRDQLRGEWAAVVDNKTEVEHDV